MMDRVYRHCNDESILQQVRRDVEALAARFPLYREWTQR
jgi:hypothetical protein